MSAGRDRLYGLLPEFIRYADAYQGEPLRALLSVLEHQVETLEGNLEQLYENWFIETCESWLVPYIGDLVGVGGLAELKPRVATQRTRVANTLAYRRRKGTAAVVRRVAGDVTGWVCRVVEYRRQLGATQHLEHLRPGAGGTVDLRRGGLELLGGPFDSKPLTPRLDGPANLPTLGLYLWRTESYPMSFNTLRRVEPPGRGRGRAAKAACYTFHPFGIDMPLFNRARTARSPLAEEGEHELPLPLRRWPLAEELAVRRRRAAAEQMALRHGAGTAERDALRRVERPATDYFVRPQVVNLRLRPPAGADGRQPQAEPLPATALGIADLGDWHRPQRVAPPGDPVAGVTALIDPLRGRVVFPGGAPPGEVAFACWYGFTSDVGGGPYGRSHTLVRPGPETWQAVIFRDAPPDGGGGEGAVEVRTLGEALERWSAVSAAAAAHEPRWTEVGERLPDGLIRVADSASLDPEPPPAGFRVTLGRGQWLVLEADDERCPGVLGDLVVEGAPDAALTLDGLWIDGTVVVRGACDLRIEHCTIRPAGSRSAGAPVPPRPAVRVEGEGSAVTVRIASSLVGPLRLPASINGLAVEDSVVDGGPLAAVAGGEEGEPGPPAVLRRVTVLGAVRLIELPLAASVLFAGPVAVDHTRYGEVRYSYLPQGSETPRRLRCQPDLALARIGDPAQRRRLRRRLAPRFTSTVYGQPGYAQLAAGTAPEIARGGEDGSEMGVYHQLFQPQREADLAGVLEEFTPWGREVRAVYVT